MVLGTGSWILFNIGELGQDAIFLLHSGNFPSGYKEIQF